MKPWNGFPICVENNVNPDPRPPALRRHVVYPRNSTFPPQAPSHKIKFPLFSPPEDLPKGSIKMVKMQNQD